MSKQNVRTRVKRNYRIPIEVDEFIKRIAERDKVSEAEVIIRAVMSRPSEPQATEPVKAKEKPPATFRSHALHSGRHPIPGCPECLKLCV